MISEVGNITEIAGSELVSKSESKFRLLVKKISKKFWLLWVIVLVLTFSIQVLTIDVLPNLPKDEAQITEYGRLFFYPKSDWSINWLLIEEQPLLLWSYIGPLISELSFHLFGSPGLGPRIAALIGGLVAATMILILLRSRGVPRRFAWWLSLAFLLDPLFGLSQRIGRVDSWVIAICIASCVLLRNSRNSRAALFNPKIMAAGGLAAIASFVWPSAIFLYPLIALELFQRSQFNEEIGKFWKNVLLNCAAFLLGGLIGVVLLLVPIWQNLNLFINQIEIVLIKNVESKSLFDRLQSLFGFDQWLKLAKAFVKTLSLFLPVFALVAVVYKRDRPLILALMTAIFLILATLIYEHRVLYLIPYLLLIVGGFFIRLSERSSVAKKNSTTAVYSLSIIAGWAILISLIVRTALGFSVKEELDRSKIQHAVRTTIGQGNVKVYLANTYELYYAGRELGWRQYIPYAHFSYDANGNWTEKGYEPREKFLTLFSNMDYAVFVQGSITNDLSNLLNESGLTYYRTILRSDSASVQKLQPMRMKSILRWYLGGPSHYGPYTIYRRL